MLTCSIQQFSFFIEAEHKIKHLHYCSWKENNKIWTTEKSNKHASNIKPLIKQKKQRSCNETDNYAPSFIIKISKHLQTLNLSGHYAPSLRVKSSAKTTQYNNIFCYFETSKTKHKKLLRGMPTNLMCTTLHQNQHFDYPKSIF
jgi:hypothetical protein